MKHLGELQKYRAVELELTAVGATGHPKIGIFIIPSPTDGRALRCIVSGVAGWDHVSISRRDRIPNWKEMCHIKELFFESDEWAMQVHPPESEWINNHPYCLHLWRPHDVEIPKPPSSMVGLKELNKER